MVSATLGLLSSLALAAPAQVPQETPRVALDLYLIDLVEITGSDQAFLADVVIIARWNDPSLASGSSTIRTLDLAEVWHPTLLVINDRGADRSLPEVVNVDPEGNVQYSLRLTGRFSETMDLRQFPLDRQEFSVFVVAPELGGRRVDLVPDTTVRMLRNEQLSISDWTVTDVALVAREFRTSRTAAPLQGVALVVNAKRNIGYYVIQVMIPLVAIVFMAWTVFWIDPSVVPTRIGVVVSTMLTLIAYRFMLGNLVPRLSYLTRLDYFMLGTTSIVVLTLFTMAGAAYLRRRGQEAIVDQIDRVGRVAFPAVFGTFSALVWLL